MTDFEKEVWRSSLCQLPASENRLILEFTDSRLVHVLYHSWALPISVNGRSTTFANTSTQNSKFFSPFSSFFDSSTKKALKKRLACENHSHRSGIGLNLWQEKVLRSGRSAHSEMARVDVAKVMTDFEKEVWRSSICQLPASENGLTLEFTDSRLVHVLYHSWALTTSVNGRPTTFANTSTQNSKFFSPFSLFYDSSTKKALKKHLAFKKKLTPSRDWLKLITNKTFTKWEVCTFRIGASTCGATFDKFRERDVKFFSLSTSDVWKQVDLRTHWLPLGLRFVPLLSSSDIGEWSSYNLGQYIDTKFQDLQSIFVVLRPLDKKTLKKQLACENHLPSFQNSL